MTWSYSGDPSTSLVDEVRFIVGDTSEPRAELSNEEIDYILDQRNDHVQLAALDAIERIIAFYARQADTTISGMTVAKSQRFSQLFRIRKQLWSELGVPVNVSSGSARKSRPGDPKIGMHDGR